MTDAGVKRARAEKTAGATPGGGDSDTDTDVEEVIDSEGDDWEERDPHRALEHAIRTQGAQLKAVNEELVALRAAFESLRELTETKYTSVLALWSTAAPTLQLMKEAEERRQRAMLGPKPKQFVTKEDVIGMLVGLQSGVDLQSL